MKIFKNFKEHRAIKAPISSSEGLFGGACVAIRGPDCICFFDWNEGAFLCKIDVAPSAMQSVATIMFTLKSKYFFNLRVQRYIWAGILRNSMSMALKLASTTGSILE